MNEKPRVNGYKCSVCQQRVITREVDDGVTPFMIQCKTENCAGMMHTNFYMVPQNMEHQYEFYKPTEEQIAEMPEDDREFYRQGGLHLREKQEAK